MESKADIAIDEVALYCKLIRFYEMGKDNTYPELAKKCNTSELIAQKATNIAIAYKTWSLDTNELWDKVKEILSKRG